MAQKIIARPIKDDSLDYLLYADNREYYVADRELEVEDNREVPGIEKLF